MHRRTLWLLALVLAACRAELDLGNPDLDAAGNAKRVIARFDLLAQEKVPFPIFLVQVDPDTGELGRLRVPGEGPLYDQINRQTGFTRLPVVTVDFSGDLDLASIRPQENLIFLGNEDSPEVEFTTAFDALHHKLYIYPKRTLAAGADYAIVLTKSIRGAGGDPIDEDLFFHLTKFKQPVYDEASGRILSDLLAATGAGPDEAAQLEMLRKEYRKNFYGDTDDLLAKVPFLKVRDDYAREHHVEASKVTDEQAIGHVAVAWAFHTSAEDPVEALTAARARIDADPAAGRFAWGASSPAAAAFKGTGYAYDEIEARGGFVTEATLKTLDFRVDGAWPAGPGTGKVANVKALLVFPGPVTGHYPVVIMQHGLTGCKRNAVLGIANTLARHGIAVAGIDAVEHGERATKNADPDNDADEPGLCGRVVDGRTIASGEAFFAIDDLYVLRDYLRQTAADLVALRKALEGVPQFDRGIGFAGQSMGGMLGAIFAGVDPVVDTVVLNVPPAWVSREFFQSEALGRDVFLPALAEKLGYADVTSETFVDLTAKIMPLVQGVFDVVEPAFYAAGLAARKDVLIQKILDDDTSLNAGTDFLALVAGIPEKQKGGEGPGLVLWPNSTHGLLFDLDGGDARDAMQEQLAIYLDTGLRTGGAAIEILP